MKIFLLIMLLSSQVLAAQKLVWPEITRENKPWTRWWWPGSIVNQSDLTANVEKYQKAGLGGMEVTIIYGVKGMEDKFIRYLSPEWMDMFTYTLKEGVRLNLGIELANASGWPFGGPWVKPEDACRNINYKTWALKEGEKLTESVTFMQQPLVRAIGLKPDIKKLSDPIATNDSLQIYALDQIRFEKPIPLQVLMAYSDKGSSLDLTRNVSTNGTLDWIAPEGNWTLYALFGGWHGKQVERAGPGGEGDVIDHFSATAIDNYLSHFDEAFKNYDIKSLSGYFNDSYEVDDASGQANWTPGLFDEFKALRGYDLKENLPALFQKDTPEKNARVLCDYRLTISDLLLEKYTTRWTAWANKQGKTTRNQSHGAPANILDLYAATDIPETEGSELTRLKFATSAANVTGKKYVSSESGTWLNEHFSSGLSDVKKALDPFFLAGVNHIFYHGTCYSPLNQPWPGFQFYASVEFSPQNSFWNDFEGLNKYVARVQSFLQQGKSDNDILLYFPIFDRYSDYGRGMLEHFDAISPAYNGTPFKKGAEIILEKGYSFDYISDLQIKNTETNNSLLQTEGNSYKTLILPGCKYIPVETFSQILKLVKNGANIIVYGNLPENISGWANLEEKTVAFNQMKESLKFNETDNKNILQAVVGDGKIIMGSELDSLLSFAGIRREPMADAGIKFIRRRATSGSLYFLKNQTEKPFEGWIPLQTEAKSAALFNPINEQFGTAKKRIAREGAFEIYLRLGKGESMFVEAFSNKVSGKPYPFYNSVSDPQEIKGKWKLDFTDGGPVLPDARELDNLISWTESGGDDVKNFSGTARYTINFSKPAVSGDAWVINLGKVCESARVILNGQELVVLIGPDYQVLVDRKVLKTTNILEIKVSNLMANRIAWMDRNKIEWKKFYNVNMAARLKENNKDGIFDASAWQPRESGLIGPVTITAIEKTK